MSGEFQAAFMDRLLAGFAHDANGRATALRGIAILAGMGEPADSWIPLLDAEAERLESLARGLSALRAEPPEPLDALDVLRAAAATLAAVHVEFRIAEVSADEDTSVIQSRGALVRAVVALALQLAPSYSITLVHARAARTAAGVSIEIWSDDVAPPALPALALPDVALERTPTTYRIILPPAS